jgi:hypothetical protein
VLTLVVSGLFVGWLVRVAMRSHRDFGIPVIDAIRWIVSPSS